jgi:type II secretory pathway pseudopilin PulG
MMSALKASRHRGIKGSRGARRECAQPRRIPHHHSCPARLAASHHRGFTLVEIVVVIGIIIGLAAIFLGVTAVINRKSEARQMDNAMTLMDNALSEWKNAADRQLTYGVDDNPFNGARYDIQEPQALGDDLPTHQLLAIIKKNTSANAMLSKIDQKLLKREENNQSVPANLKMGFDDPWDKEVLTIFPGRKYIVGQEPSNVLKDSDGTIRTAYETAYGECDIGNIFFVSAGPDGEYGNLHLDLQYSALSAQQQKEVLQAADNIYSHAPRMDRGVLP